MAPSFSCHLLVALGVLLETNLGIFTEGNFCYLHHNLPLGVTNEEVSSTPIKRIFGAVARDSKSQDRGVARCPLPLLFSLVKFTLQFLSLLVLYQKNPKTIVYLFPYLPSMSNFFETRYYWQGQFIEDQQEYYKEYRLSKKGIHLWRLIHQLYEYARNLCSIYDIYFYSDKSCCFMRYKHLNFQC